MHLVGALHVCKMILLWDVCMLLVEASSSTGMPTSLPSQYYSNNVSTMLSLNDNSAQQNHHETNVIEMMMMIPSGSMAPSIQPSNNNNHASNDNEIPTMQPATQPSFASDATQQTLIISPLHPTRMPSPSRGIFSSALSSSIQQSMGNYFGRPTTPSRYAPSSSSCLMSQTHNSCFVSTFPKYKSITSSRCSQVLTPKRTRVCNLMLSNKNMHGGRTNLWLGSDNNINMLGPTPNKNEPPQGNNEQQLLILPLTMYSIVPFIPSSILSALNDEYLTLKGQFNIASASLLPNVATDSVEYLAAQDMYNDTMQSLFVLLLSKRLALYFLGTVTTVYAGWRASMSVTDIRKERFGGSGDHLDKLTEEVLKGEVFYGKSIAASSIEGLADEEVKDDKQENNEDKENDVFATLIDNNPSDVGTSLALGLPLVLGASLATSYILTISQTTSDEASTGVIQELLSSEYVPYLSSLPSVILCLLFMATEFRWILPSDGTYQNPETNTSTSPLFCAGNVLALLYILGAYGAKIYPTLMPLDGINLDLWPLQNGVNIALAATVARALSPFLFPVQSTSSSSSGITSIRTAALALVGLAIFDGISTFGTANVANAAEATITATQSSMSVMETVARDKLASWQPGLLEIILGHGSTRVSEALGVGDVVFPSILVTWGFVADNDVNLSRLAMNDKEGGLGSINNISESSNNKFSGFSYTSAAIMGYLVGSFATEIVGSFSLLGNRGGLPALVFLVPSMLAAVTVLAWSRDELDEVWGSIASNDEDA